MRRFEREQVEKFYNFVLFRGFPLLFLFIFRPTNWRHEENSPAKRREASSPGTQYPGDSTGRATKRQSGAQRLFSAKSAASVAAVGAVPVRRHGDRDMVMPGAADFKDHFDKRIDRLLLLFAEVLSRLETQLVDAVIGLGLREKIADSAVAVGDSFADLLPGVLLFRQPVEKDGDPDSGPAPPDIQNVGAELIPLSRSDCRCGGSRCGGDNRGNSRPDADETKREEEEMFHA